MNGNWKIIYSKHARLDLHEIDNYIRNILLAENAATNTIDAILKEIDDLTFWPQKHQLFSTQPWHDLGIRYVPVKHYTIFYKVDAETHTVQIIRIL